MKFFKKIPDSEITICINDESVVEARTYTYGRKLLNVATLDVSDIVKKPRGAYLSRDYLYLIVIDSDYTQVMFALVVPGDINTANFTKRRSEINNPRKTYSEGKLEN